MMKKKVAVIVLAAGMTLAGCMTALASGWQKNDTGWWYATNDEGTAWYADEWQWIDGNGDGVAESYCFDQNGYLYTDTITPDGYTVNADGAWVENGQVQTKEAAQPVSDTGAAVSDAASENVPDVSGVYRGVYKGMTINAEIMWLPDENRYWAEVDMFLKDYLPDYVGNGVFRNDYTGFEFNGSTLVFHDYYSDETVTLTKQ